MEEHLDGAYDPSNTNLIINYLPQNLSDDDFRNLFLNIGPIKNSKIVRDKATGYSYGFGFIDYQLAADAERAIHSLSGHPLGNKHIKVAYARKGEQIKGANLYVRNLPQHWKEEELNNLFKPYGKIIQSRVLVDIPTGVSKRVGFVLFDTRDQAEYAIKELNGKTPEGCTEPILTKFADDNSKKIKQQQMHGPLQLVSFPPSFPAGPGPMRNQLTRMNTRFNPMAGNYQQYQQPGTQNGNFQRAMGYQDNHPENVYTLFVYNIGSNATDHTLYSMFAPYGTVQKVNIMLDHDKNQCKGFGFVTMTNIVEAQNAINGLNGRIFQGKQLQVSFKANKNTQDSMNMAGGATVPIVN